MSQQNTDSTLAPAFFHVATQCGAVLKLFCRGRAKEAKKSLQRLAQEHPNSFLPHRYLARLLYHESARVEADQQGAAGTRRLALLHSALLEAKQASELAPGSLSSAALRATLLVNLLVEESALQGGLAVGQEQPPQPAERSQAAAGEASSGQSGASLSSEVAWYQLQPEARCEAIKREFRDAIAHCVRTLECSSPLLVEPVITISDAHARTCDPCCLRVQDNIVEWVKQDNWQRIVAEKRSVLACMHQVLESCHTLLDSTHIPVDGIVRLLQHILRPHQQDLQLWASQLLLSKGSVDDLQHKFETQAAVTELLRMLRPGSRPGEEGALGALPPAPPGVPAGLPQPPVSMQQAVQQQQPHVAPAQQQAYVQLPAQQVKPAAQQHQQHAHQQQHQHQQPHGQQQTRAAAPAHELPPPPPAARQTANAGAIVPQPPAQQQQVAPPPPPPAQQNLAPCLSAEQEWDEVRDGGGATGGANAGAANAAGAARRPGSKAKNKAKGGDAARGPRKERSRYERYMDVETFWRSTTPEQRAALLKVPMAALLKSVRRDQGNDAVDELIEGLVLLREQGNRAACYWLCPVCEQKFHSSRDFLGHVELVHEGLAVQDNKYVCCYKCQQDVVGMYYTSTRTPGYNLCFRCYGADANSANSPEAFEKVFMRPSAGGRAWSHDDFMSTRDSFSSLSERSHRHALQQHPQQQQHAHQQQQQPQLPAAHGQQQLPQQAGQRGAAGSGHVHSAACRHHPDCPHHGHGLEATSAQAMLTFGEASDEWLAPLPVSSISAPVSSAVPDPRAFGPGSHPPGAAASAAGRRRGAQPGSGDGADSGDDVVGADSQLHSRSLSEPPNGPQPGGGQVPGAGDDGSEGAGGSNATWRSWWPTRLMSGWSGKGQQQAQPVSQGPGPGGAGGPADGPGDKGGPAGQRHDAGGREDLDDDDGSDAADIVLPPPPVGAGGAAGLGAGVMNGMVAELMARLREIYLTDRDLGDMSLGSITQFVYRKLGAGAAADDTALAACPPGPRAVLLDFLAQPSIVFQRPQALAVVLGLLPLADLQMVAAYAVRQHEEAVSGAEAAARDIAAGSDEEDGLALDGGAFGDDSGSGSDISDSDEFRLERAAAREAAAAAAEAAMAAAASNHASACMPRARRRLRYTSRRAAPPGGAAAVGSGQSGVPLTHQAGAAPGTPPLPPHGGGAYAIGGSHALNLRRTDDDGSAEEVSEEEMGSAGDGGLDFSLGGPEAPGDRHDRQHGQQLRGAQAAAAHYDSHSAQRVAAQQHARQLQQLRHAGGAGMHGLANARGGAGGRNAQQCDGERSLGDGSLADEDLQGDEVTEEEEVDARCDEGALSDEDDGVSLGPEEEDEEDEEEDGPCVSLFVVSGDVELGFDRLITQMWGGGAESDDAAGQGQLEAGAAAAALPLSAPGAGKDRASRGVQQAQQGQSRGGRNAQQQSGGAVRQLSPTARTANGNASSASGAAGTAGTVALTAGNGDETVAAEELSGPRADEPYLQVADWWLQHLRLEGPPPNANQAQHQQLVQLQQQPGSADEMRVLRWLYGNIINVQAEEFCARQRELRGGRERDVAILELYDEVAAVWRSLQAVTDKRSRLEALRRAARGHFAVVKRLEEAGGHATLEQATEFLDAVLSGYCQGQQQQQLLQQQAAQQQLPAPPAAGADAPSGSEAAALPPPSAANAAPEQPGTPTTSSEGTQQQGDGSALAVAPGGATAAVMAAVTAGGAGGPSGPLLYLCERAVEVVRRHPALAQEPSQRYAAALLERELSVLALVEVMVAAEAEEAARERGVAEESLKRHRAEHREAEAEYQRVQAEGPASHRKKDLLDKATKEAEHREQLRELAARLASLSDSIAADEASKAKWADKQEEAERELTHVRDAIRQTSARRASLLDVCATLDVPFAPPPPHAQAAGPAASGSRAPMLPPAVPDAEDDTAADTAADTVAASHSAAGDAVAAVGAAAAGVTAAGVAAAAAADMEWRTTRLECLMYRVLWVSEAVKMFQAQYSPRQSTHHYDLFIRATHWAKQLSEEYEESIRAYCCELERLRARLRDVAAVDLGYEIGSAALEVARRRVEAAAHAAREAASLTLLKELEEEEERRKAAASGKDGKDAGAARDAGAGKKATANKKAAVKATAADLKKQKDRERELAKQAEEEARKRAEEEDKERVAAARRAREAAIEAELERRRRELEELEAQREAEAIRAAQEASLREQQLREQREREAREAREREAKERAAAAAAAQAQAQANASAQQQQQQAGAKANAAQQQGGKANSAQAKRQGSAEAAAQDKAQQQAPAAANKRNNAAPAARGKGAANAAHSPGSPEAPAAVLASAATSPPLANGGRVPPVKAVATTAANSGPASAPSSAKAGAGKQAAQAPAGAVVGDAAAAVAAATAGISGGNGSGNGSNGGKGTAALRGSPVKGGAAQLAAGGNAARRAAQQQASQAGQHSPQDAPPQQHAPLPLPHGPPGALDAASAGPAGPGPLSPGSEFPPLSAAGAAAAQQHRGPQAHPPPPPQQQQLQQQPGVQMPPNMAHGLPQQQAHMHPGMQPQAQQQMSMQPQGPQGMPQPHQMPPPQGLTAAQAQQLQAQQQMQAHAAQQMQAHAAQQMQAQAHAYVEAQARLMVLAQVPAATAAAVAAAAAVAQGTPAAAPGDMQQQQQGQVLPSEHLHAQLRQQAAAVQQAALRQQIQAQLQAQALQQAQAQAQAQAPLFQPTPRPLGGAGGLPGMPVGMPGNGNGSSMFDPFAENPLLRALSAMEAKTPPPVSPNTAMNPAAALAAAAAAGIPVPGMPPNGTAGPAPGQAAPPGAGAAGGVQPQGPHAQHPAHMAMAPGGAPGPDPLMAAMQASVGTHGTSSAAASAAAETDTHIMSIMSILDQDGASPSPSPATGGGNAGGRPGSSGAAGGAPRASPGGSAASAPGAGAGGAAAGSSAASAAASVSSSPQRPMLPPAPPPGPPASMYGNAFGTDGSPAAGNASISASPARPGAGAAGAGGMPNLANGGIPPVPMPGGAGAGEGLPGLSSAAAAAFGSGIWRQQGGEQLGGNGMLGLGLGLSGIGAGPNTWGTAGLPAAGGPGGAAANAGSRPGGGGSTSPRRGSTGGAADWGNGGNGGAGGNGGSHRDDLDVDSLVAALPSSLLPSSLDADPAPPSTPANSGLAATAAPFYPASLRGKGSGGHPGPGQGPQQMHMGGGPGVMHMGGPMGPGGAFSGDGAAAWIGGMGPGKPGMNPAAAAAMAAANGMMGNGPHGGMGPGGMGSLPGGMGPAGAMRGYGMGLYSGDAVNWSVAGMMQGGGGGMPPAMRGAGGWGPFGPPGAGAVPGSQQMGQQAQQGTAQQQQQQQASQAGWPRGQRWRN